MPFSGSSLSGHLSISSESDIGKVAIMNVDYNFAAKRWDVSNGENVVFSSFFLGNVRRFCSGTVTPDNTIMVCEESLFPGDLNTVKG